MCFEKYETILHFTLCVCVCGDVCVWMLEYILFSPVKHKLKGSDLTAVD